MFAIYRKHVIVKKISLVKGIYFDLFRNIKKGFSFVLFLHVRDKMHTDKIGLVRSLVF